MFDLIAGAVLVGISVLMYLVLQWGARRPAEPIWMRETLVANVHVPFLVGAMTFGVCYLIRFAALMVA